MIGQHECFEGPKDDNQALWRYVDLPKFLNILQTKSLWFARGDTLGDPYEGSITQPMRTERDAMLPKMNPAPWQDLVRTYYISCWHGSEHKSAAMWKLYSQSNESVCIRTTFSAISKILPEYAYGGRVKYIDYENDSFPAGNVFHTIMHKRMSFEHEREYRFVFWDFAQDSTPGELQRAKKGSGIAWPVEPSTYIEAIYVSPTSPEWFREIVIGAAKIYGLDVPVHQSSLLRDPVF